MPDMQLAYSIQQCVGKGGYTNVGIFTVAVVHISLLQFEFNQVPSLSSHLNVSVSLHKGYTLCFSNCVFVISHSDFASSSSLVNTCQYKVQYCKTSNIAKGVDFLSKGKSASQAAAKITHHKCVLRQLWVLCLPMNFLTRLKLSPSFTYVNIAPLKLVSGVAEYLRPQFSLLARCFLIGQYRIGNNFQKQNFDF